MYILISLNARIYFRARLPIYSNSSHFFLTAPPPPPGKMASDQLLGDFASDHSIRGASLTYVKAT